MAGTRAVALGLLALASACAPSNRVSPPAAPADTTWQTKLDAGHPLVGTIWDVAAGRRIAEAELIARVQATDLVLVGETHDNPDHHRLQATLIAAFAARHASPAVVFEMLDRQQQPDIEASLTKHPGDADALSLAVHWDSSGWPAWPMYRPVFQAAVDARGPVLAGGIDRRVTMRIAEDGVAAYDPGLTQTFGLGDPLPAEVAAAMRHEMSESHCGLLPPAMLDPMVLVQRVRDAFLAERLHEGAGGGHGALLIAGAGHVRRDRGVPAQLLHAFGARSLAIGLLEAKAESPTPESYAARFDTATLPFDYVWFTPRASDEDHCAEMQEHMKAHARPADGGP